MKLNRKIWLVLAGAALGVVTGCGGIHASHSISPASFFLPGLMQTAPPATPAAKPAVVLAGSDRTEP